jgi:tetratricopeptide (TPR) repeat protein
MARTRALRLFTTLAGRENVSFQLEDLHHADDASLDFFNDLFRADDRLHLLAVGIARPDLFRRRPDWGSGQASHTRLDLKPLDRRESRDLVQEILKKVDEVPKSLRDLLVDRAEGNPYYLEELVKMLIDDHVIVRENEEHWRVEEGRLGALQVPPTLFGLLEARFDTLLPPEKLVLQRAAVFGRIFYDRVLEAMDGADDAHVTDLPAVLATLAKREFIFRRETSVFAGSQEYIFGQAMLRDTIYDRLLERQLRVYHRAAAAWLASLDRGKEFLPLIADHYLRAEAETEAVETLRRAGEWASLRGLGREAVEHYERALSLLTEGELPLRLSLLLAIGNAATLRGDFPHAHPALEKALDLARSLDLPAEQANALSQLSRVETLQGDYPGALSRLEGALPLARASGDRAALANVLYGQANVRFRLGDNDEGLVSIEECVQLARELGENVLLLEAINRRGTLLDAIGRYDEARAEFVSGLALAQQLGLEKRQHPILTNLGYLELREGNFDGAKTNLETALGWSREREDLQGIIFNGVNLAFAYLRTEEASRARPLIKEVLQAARASGSFPAELSAVGTEGERLLALGETGRGLALLGLSRHHPASSADIRTDIQMGLDFWAPRLGLTQPEIEAGLAAGKSLDLDQVVDQCLGSKS